MSIYYYTASIHESIHISDNLSANFSSSSLICSYEMGSHVIASGFRGVSGMNPARLNVMAHEYGHMFGLPE